MVRLMSDERLALMARDGHDFAFEELVRRYRTPLARYLMRRRLPVAAVDRAFVRAWAALLGGAVPVEVRPWLYGLVGARLRPGLVTRAGDAARGAVTAVVPPEAVVRANVPQTTL
jgi:DNA-directed RNA polymerase specialized sigma24 family protein